MLSKPVEGPPKPFLSDFPIFSLAKGTSLHRIHDVAYPPNSFDTTKAEYRFSPIWDLKNQIVSVLYAGESQECAFMETIFRHLAGTTLARQRIREPKLRARAYGVISTAREMQARESQGPRPGDV